MPPSWPKLPDLPRKTAHIWGWYREIDALGGDFSPMQLQAYFSLHGINPKQWEVDAILGLVGVGRGKGEKPSK